MTTILKSAPFLATTYEDGTSSVATVDASILFAAIVGESKQDIVGSTEDSPSGKKPVKVNYISNVTAIGPAGPNAVTVEFDFGEKTLTEGDEEAANDVTHFSTILAIDYVK
jgi:hypothetical protein